MRIIYLSCHAVLEFEELKLLSRMGHEVFSLHGSYQNPENAIESDKRPGIKGLKQNQHLNDLAIQCSRDNIHDDLFKWADAIMTMHRVDWLENSWKKIEKYGVIPIWRTIGQSHSHWEKRARKLPGLKIIRYSPMEENIPDYAGADAIIRFHVNPVEYTNWTGGDNRVHVFGQSLKERAEFCGYHLMEAVTDKFPRVMYGTKNAEDAEKPEFKVDWAAGPLSYEDLKTQYRLANAAFYYGSVPASYTLTFVEMMMTGVPLVCAGKSLFNLDKHFPFHDLYEIPYIIENGVNGFVSDDINELRAYVAQLLRDPLLGRKISAGARETAKKLFNKDTIKNHWGNFLGSL